MGKTKQRCWFQALLPSKGLPIGSNTSNGLLRFRENFRSARHGGHTIDAQLPSSTCHVQYRASRLPSGKDARKLKPYWLQSISGVSLSLNTELVGTAYN